MVEYTTYCGYVDWLMVVIFLTRGFLLIFFILLGCLILIGKGIFIIRVKIFNVGFFGDFELLFSG